MARKPTGRPNGRPKKEIDKEQFEKLCGLQCTLEEIAGFFNCSEDKINNWCKDIYGEGFSGIFKIYSQTGKVSLRRAQFELAKHSATMAIFLGKQMLEQKETMDANVSVSNPMQGFSDEELRLLARINQDTKTENSG